MCVAAGRRADECFEVKVSSCKEREAENDRKRVCETDKRREGECVHSWPYPVGCGLRKASVGATCVGGVSQTETQAWTHTLTDINTHTHAQNTATKSKPLTPPYPDKHKMTTTT